MGDFKRLSRATKERTLAIIDSLPCKKNLKMLMRDMLVVACLNNTPVKIELVRV